MKTFLGHEILQVVFLPVTAVTSGQELCSKLCRGNLDHSQGKWFAPGEALPPGFMVCAHPDGHTAPQEGHSMSDQAGSAESIWVHWTTFFKFFHWTSWTFLNLCVFLFRSAKGWCDMMGFQVFFGYNRSTGRNVSLETWHACGSCVRRPCVRRPVRALLSLRAPQSLALRPPRARYAGWLMMTSDDCSRLLCKRCIYCHWLRTFRTTNLMVLVAWSGSDLKGTPKSYFFAPANTWPFPMESLSATPPGQEEQEEEVHLLLRGTLSICGGNHSSFLAGPSFPMDLS